MARHQQTLPIIIKHVHKGHSEPHGNTAWKIALADFMTAMFIVFLLLWLTNQVTPTQRQGIADYFSPNAVSRSTNGAGSVLSGENLSQRAGVQNSDSAPIGTPGGGPSVPKENEGSTTTPGFPGITSQHLGDDYGGAQSKYRTADTDGKLRYADAPRKGDKHDPRIMEANQQMLRALVKNLRMSIQAQPDLKDLQQNLLTDITPEGLRIQLVDNEKKELFAKASATPLPQTIKLMALVSKTIADLPNQITITGHTDNAAYGAKATYTNWELSADRANASRRLLTAGGIGEARFAEINGVADRQPLFPDDPASPRNRRISIQLLNDPQSTGLEGATPTTTAAASPAPEGPLIRR